MIFIFGKQLPPQPQKNDIKKKNYKYYIHLNKQLNIIMVHFLDVFLVFFINIEIIKNFLVIIPIKFCDVAIVTSIIVHM